MPTISDTAICIRHWDYSETSQTVSLFTQTHGVVRGLAKGSRRPKAPFSGGIDVATRGQVVAIVKQGRELVTITEWRLLDPCRPVRSNLAANRAGLYMVDLVHHLVTDHDPHPALFDRLADALTCLADIGAIPLIVLQFQLVLLSETGYRPELEVDAQTGDGLPADAATLAFSPAAGGIVSDTGGPDRWRVRQATVQLLREVAIGAEHVSADPEIISRANRLIAAYVRELIGSEPPTMSWAFGDLGR